MPYIDDHARVAVDAGMPPKNAGQLTYKFYKIALDYLGDKFCFMDMALVLGCLLCTILELYRRKAAPYEDEKINLNGDVL